MRDGPDGPTTNETVPVAQVIDPIPIRYRRQLPRVQDVGRQVATTTAGASGRRPRHHGGTLIKQDIVPLGTGGVFAEAVLGRSNAAEKLDITRFWDWQDSPIPLQPTEIAADPDRLSGDQRGHLARPAVEPHHQHHEPDIAPVPSGPPPSLQAIQNGSMFRDMSGLQATIGLVQASIAQTMAGASAAGQQAGENMNNLLKANTERQRTAAEMVRILRRPLHRSTQAGRSPPEAAWAAAEKVPAARRRQGAKINYFDATAKTGAAGAAAGAAGAAAGGAAAGAARRSGRRGRWCLWWRTANGASGHVLAEPRGP